MPINISEDLFWVFILLSTSSFISMTYGLWILNFIKNSVKISAFVTDCIAKKGANRRNCYEVSYEFKDQDGNLFKSNHYSVKKIEKQKKLEILYLKSNPNKIKINSFHNLYFIPFALIVINPIATIVVIIMI
jgi:hypothetical protein